MNEITLPPSHFPATIIPRSANEKKGIDAALKALQKRQPILAGVEPEDVFTWPAIISNQRLDSYSTKMASSSLRNYAEDATEGVAFLNSHRHNELPIGYSLKGIYEEGDEDDEAFPRVKANFYTVRGLNLNGLSTDQFIRGVEVGVIRDVSIGFSGGSYTCSICGRSLWDYACHHIPGVEYTEVDNPEADPDDQTERTEMCFAWVEDARLSEVSAVFDGACPDAMITKAQREATEGRLNSNTRQFLESRYRLEIKDRLYIPANTESNKENEMANEKETSGAPEKRSEMFLEVRGVAKSSGFDLRVGSEDDVIKVVEQLGTEVERLKPFESLAAEGKKLREQLVADTVKEGIRAFGDKFDKDAQEKMLATVDIETVNSLRAAWKQLGDQNFAGKKRQSADDPENKEEGSAKTGPDEKDLENDEGDDDDFNDLEDDLGDPI